jgi:hypothetical protein
MTAPGPLDDDEGRALAASLRRFLEWVHHEDGARTDNEVVRLLRDHLAGEQGASSVVTRDLPVFEHVNLQAALDAWSAEPGRTVAVHGIARPPHFGPIELSMLVHGVHLPPVTLTAPDLVDLPSGPDRTLACLRLGLLLVQDARGSYALLVRGPEPQHGAGLVVEVAGPAPPRRPRTCCASSPSCARG